MEIATESIPREAVDYLRRSILALSRRNPHVFPWRDCPNPFHALVAEILLQRTRAEQVVPVYLRFIEKFPNPADLARANISDIESVIGSLGLRWRAKFLNELGTRLLNSSGTIPATLEQLLDLPGVGMYAASAFLSLHMGKRVPIVDSNIVRLYGRFFGFDTGPESRRNSQLLALADIITPIRAFKTFNYALLDFTREVCKPKPAHVSCPIRRRCVFYKYLNRP